MELLSTDLIQLMGVIINSIIAFFAFYQVRVIRKEISILEKQAVFERMQIYPIVDILNLEFDENHVLMKLKNIGNGIATKLALSVLIHPVELVNNRFQITEDSKLNIIQEGTRKTIKIEPMKTAIFLKNEHEKFTLYPTKDDLFSSHILSLFKITKDRMKWFNFKELKEIFLYNKIRYAAFLCSLAYQDFSENITETKSIATLVIDFNKHNNFSEVINDEIGFHMVTVSQEEIPYLSWDTYAKGKSFRHFLNTEKFDN